MPLCAAEAGRGGGGRVLHCCVDTLNSSTRQVPQQLSPQTVVRGKRAQAPASRSQRVWVNDAEQQHSDQSSLRPSRPSSVDGRPWHGGMANLLLQSRGQGCPYFPLFILRFGANSMGH